MAGTKASTAPASSTAAFRFARSCVNALLGLVGDGAGAGHLHVAGVRLACRHRPGRGRRMLRERLRLPGVVPGRHPHPAGGCEAVEPLVRVDRESALAELAVVDDVDPEVHLPAHDVVDRAQELLLVVGRVQRPALVLRQHHASMSSRGRGRLPVCVTRMRSVLCSMGGGGVFRWVIRARAGLKPAPTSVTSVQGNHSVFLVERLAFAMRSYISVLRLLVDGWLFALRAVVSCRDGWLFALRSYVSPVPFGVSCRP